MVIGKVDIHHLKIIAHIPENLFVEFSVIAQTAGAPCLDQHIGSLFQCLQVASHHTFERSTDEIRTVLRADLNGMFRHRRRRYIVASQAVKDKMPDRHIVISQLGIR